MYAVLKVTSTSLTFTFCFLTNAGDVMPVLLNKVSMLKPDAARVLEEADLRTDHELQSLTRQDLLELFPGDQNFKLRRNIYEIIHEQSPIEVLLKETKDLIPDESFRGALSSNGVLNDYLQILKGLKTQMDDVQTFIDAHIDLMDEYSKNQDPNPTKGFGVRKKIKLFHVTGISSGTSTPDTSDSWEFCTTRDDDRPQSAQGDMPELLKEIKRLKPEAAKILEQADLRTNHELQSLTRQDLLELFPGAQNLKLRRNIYEIIHKQKPIKVLLKEMKDLIPDESFWGALSSNGVLNDYLQILKGLKTQMDDVQTFIDAHIDLMDEYGKNQDPNPTKGISSGTSTPDTSDSREFPTLRDDDHPQGTQGEKTSDAAVYFPKDAKKATVLFYMVVSGETFGAHNTLLEKVRNKAKFHLNETNNVEDCQVIIVFCPISSRVGSDVEAAMNKVPATGDKPVILVLMHHSYSPRTTASLRTWAQSTNTIKLDVNVFYHETVKGLIKCDQNEQGVREIHTELLSLAGLNKENSGDISSAGATRGSRSVGSSDNRSSADDSSSSRWSWSKWRQ
ncbi:hypothetical protein LDENG_00123340 [Lucifuga dentata]|nr:hypothetical protein LDENG_00123340 [Lucifuga dentata]